MSHPHSEPVAFPVEYPVPFSAHDVVVDGMACPAHAGAALR